MPAPKLDVERCARIVVAAFRTYAEDNLHDPYAYFMPPGGMVGFVNKALRDAGITDIAPKYAYNHVIPHILKSGMLVRQGERVYKYKLVSEDPPTAPQPQSLPRCPYYKRRRAS